MKVKRGKMKEKKNLNLINSNIVYNICTAWSMYSRSVQLSTTLVVASVGMPVWVSSSMGPYGRQPTYIHIKPGRGSYDRQPTS